MRRTIFGAITAVALAGLSGCVGADAGMARYYEVSGVEVGDLLKLRAGPGIGFRVIAGLPNGTVLRLQRCEQTGGTRWCKATLKGESGLEGYVSWAYLRGM